MHLPSVPRTLRIALLVALPLLLAACSGTSSGGPKTTTRPAGHQAASSACSLVTAAQIGVALGRQVGTPTVTNSTAATACSFPATRGGKSDSVIVTFRGRVSAANAASEQAALTKLHISTTPVTVSSGQAYTYSVAAGAQTVISLVTLVGQTQVTITSTASVGQMETLSEQIFHSFASAATSTTAPVGAPAP